MSGSLLFQHLIRRFRTLPRPRFTDYLFLTFGLALVVRYLWMLDDSFIFFRYVDNLLFLDRGLVNNPGEYVEGFSSPGWVLLLIPLRAIGLDYWFIVAMIAVVAFVVFWVGLLWINGQLTSCETSVNSSMIFLCTNYGVLSYFSSGTVTPLVQLLSVAAAGYALKPHSRMFQVAVALAPLCRGELVVPLLVLVGSTYLLRERRIPWLLLSVASATGIGWLLFRVYYYADLFPNTFYLKDTVNWSRGWTYVQNTAKAYALLPLIVAFTVMGLTLRRLRPDGVSNLRARVVMWVTAAAALPYVLKIGGDMMHYRFLAFPFCLMVISSSGVFEHWLDLARLGQRRGSRLAIALGVGAFSLMLYPESLNRHPISNMETREIQLGISDAAFHRHHPNLRYHLGRGREDRQQRSRYADHVSKGHTPFWTIDMTCWDIFRGYRYDTIHGYGLTDAILARTRMREASAGHKPGLRRLAKELLEIRRRYGEGRPGMHREAVAAGAAPAWIARNLETIEIIERKIYNQHRLRENLKLAFTRVKRITPE